MQCITCKVEILPAFKHAVAKNECRACGGQILDEESLALIEDVERTISSEISLREGTANRLAIALVTKYDMVMKDEQQQQVSLLAAPRPRSQVQAQTQQAPMKIAPSSILQQMQQVAAGGNIMQSEGDVNVVKFGELSEDISDSERERIMADVVSKRYGMVEGVASMDTGFDTDVSGLVDPTTLPMTSPFSEGNANPLLEAERLQRLAKQQQALRSGSGTFRR